MNHIRRDIDIIDLSDIPDSYSQSELDSVTAADPHKTPLGYDHFLMLISVLKSLDQRAIQIITERKYLDNNNNNNNNCNNLNHNSNDDNPTISLPYIDCFNSSNLYQCNSYDLIAPVLAEIQQNFVPKHLQSFIRTAIRRISSTSDHSAIEPISQDQLLGPVKDLIQKMTKNLRESASLCAYLPLSIHIQYNNIDEISDEIVINSQCSDTISILLERITESILKSSGVKHQFLLQNFNESQLHKTILELKLWETIKLIATAQSTEETEIIDNKKKHFQVQIQTITGKKHHFKVFSSMLVEHFRDLIHQQLNIEPHTQRLIFAGKHLENGNELQDYSIQSNSLIHLVVRVRGTAMHWNALGRDQNTNPLACTDEKTLFLLNRLMEFSSSQPSRSQLKTKTTLELANWLADCRSLIARIHSAVLQKDIVGYSSRGQSWIDDKPNFIKTEIVRLEDEFDDDLQNYNTMQMKRTNSNNETRLKYEQNNHHEEDDEVKLIETRIKVQKRKVLETNNVINNDTNNNDTNQNNDNDLIVDLTEEVENVDPLHVNKGKSLIPETSSSTDSNTPSKQAKLSPF